tara:strand:- start:146 stop:418 length:273 start_codon:yes stop_codon:yes gene_type:complete
MGIGSAYLEIQTYGGTLIGVIVAVGGVLGLLFSKTTKGTLISGAAIIIGGAIMVTASKVRTTYQENKEFNEVGKVFLGLAIFGALLKAIK